jgi:fluoride ion exporter CrcB/FEX
MAPMAAINVVVSNVAGLAMVWLGLSFARNWMV